MKQAVIAGATGLVGAACLNLLLDRYDSVTAFVRHSTGRTHARLLERHIDFDRIGTIDLPPAVHVYCAFGTTIKTAGSEDAFRHVDYEIPKMLAERTADSLGSRFMLVSSVGAKSSSGNFYLRTKGELEDAVSALPIDAVHILRPSVLVGQRVEARPGEKFGIVMTQKLGFALIGGLRKYRAMPVPMLARAMVGAASRNEHGRFVYHYDEIHDVASRAGPRPA
jgi:uncharacterized protein YbjT (DUF2867 family)